MATGPCCGPWNACSTSCGVCSNAIVMQAGVLSSMCVCALQNDSLATLLARLEGILGPLPRHLLREGRYAQRFYTRSGALFDRNPRTVRPLPAPHSQGILQAAIFSSAPSAPQCMSMSWCRSPHLTLFGWRGSSQASAS